MNRQLLYSFRILLKYPLYTAINVIGMGTAIAVSLLIGNYIVSAYNYDAFHEHKENIYRLSMEITTADGTEHFANTGKPLGRLLTQEFSAVKSSAQLIPYRNAKIEVSNERFHEKGVYEINPGTLDVFSFRFLQGNRASCFSQSKTVLLTKKMAKKYFNSIEVIGETIHVEDEDYLVSGVIEDWPNNSHLEIEVLLNKGKDTSAFELQDWFNMDYYTYLLLDKDSDLTFLSASLNQLTSNHITPHLEGSGVSVAFRPQPLNGLYFEKGLIGDLPKGNWMYVNALAIAALLILMLSCFNCINLTLTQSVSRAKEISVKKTLGIQRKQLLIQFGLESFIMILFSTGLAAVLIIMFTGLFKHYTSMSLVDSLTDLRVLAGVLVVFFVSGLIGNSYSGGYLTFSGGINKINEKLSMQVFKNMLIGFQFCISAIMIMMIITMNKQIKFMQNKGLGFDKEGIAVIKLPEDEGLKNEYIAFRDMISNHANVQKASLIGGGALPGEDNGKELFQVIQNGNKEEKVYNIYRIDEAYFDLLGIHLASGRNFDKNRPSDTATSVIINEMLAKSLNWDEPLGKVIFFGYGGKPKKVVGVVKNFHNKSLHHVIEPIVFTFDENYSSNLLIKTLPSNVDLLKADWERFFPDKPFSLTFFDDFLNAQYTREVRLANLLSLFSMLALIIAAMGLFAIFSLNITQRIKEISIRKVLGADLANLIIILARKYFLIILVAICLSVPVSWYAMNYWLTSFAFRIDTSPEIFVYSIVTIAFICIVTMLHHLYRIFGVNPAKTLRED